LLGIFFSADSFFQQTREPVEKKRQEPRFSTGPSDKKKQKKFGKEATVRAPEKKMMHAAEIALDVLDGHECECAKVVRQFAAATPDELECCMELRKLPHYMTISNRAKVCLDNLSGMARLVDVDAEYCAFSSEGCTMELRPCERLIFDELAGLRTVFGRKSDHPCRRIILDIRTANMDTMLAYVEVVRYIWFCRVFGDEKAVHVTLFEFDFGQCVNRARIDMDCVARLLGTRGYVVGGETSGWSVAWGSNDPPSEDYFN
jgi:hypothetical protein